MLLQRAGQDWEHTQGCKSTGGSRWSSQAYSGLQRISRPALQAPGVSHPTQTGRPTPLWEWFIFKKHRCLHITLGSATQTVCERGDTQETSDTEENPKIYQTMGQGKGVSCENLKHISSAVAFLFQCKPQVSHVLGTGKLTDQSPNKVTFVS